MGEISEALESVDWNFDDSSGSESIHSLHPYPAKFIPEIPRELVRLFYPEDSSPILDPFCGSGTTLVEAMRLGIDSWGVDINPLACLITRVKTTPLRVSLDRIARRVSEAARIEYRSCNVNVPQIPNLDHWFKPDIQIAIAALVREIKSTQPLKVREALELALSRIIVKVSKQESDTRYAAVAKEGSSDDVFDRFERSGQLVHRAVSSLSPTLFHRLGKATVLNRDILGVQPSNLPDGVSLVITSPPYPNAYEYWLYHKYRMYWLGMDPLAVRRAEIGARPHYFKKNHQDERDFQVQMGSCFRLLSAVMRMGGKACFLVGRSIIHGREIDNVSLLRNAAQPHGFVLQGVVERRIRRTRKAFNPSHAKIAREHLMIFSLERLT